MTQKCVKCGSRWPAMVTLEAVYNYNRGAKTHPKERCVDKDGNEFGPIAFENKETDDNAKEKG